MGVSVVRGLGFVFPCRRDGAGRFGLFKSSVVAVLARMVHASKWATPGVRVGLWRRESASARVGFVACIQNRSKNERQSRFCFSGACLSQAPDELHLVGES